MSIEYLKQIGDLTDEQREILADASDKILDKVFSDVRSFDRAIRNQKEFYESMLLDPSEYKQMLKESILQRYSKLVGE